MFSQHSLCEELQNEMKQSLVPEHPEAHENEGAVIALSRMQLFTERLLNHWPYCAARRVELCVESVVKVIKIEKRTRSQQR